MGSLRGGAYRLSTSENGTNLPATLAARAPNGVDCGLGRVANPTEAALTDAVEREAARRYEPDGATVGVTLSTQRILLRPRPVPLKGCPLSLWVQHHTGGQDDVAEHSRQSDSGFRAHRDQLRALRGVLPRKGVDLEPSRLTQRSARLSKWCRSAAADAHESGACWVCQTRTTPVSPHRPRSGERRKRKGRKSPRASPRSVFCR